MEKDCPKCGLPMLGRMADSLNMLHCAEGCRFWYREVVIDKTRYDCFYYHGLMGESILWQVNIGRRLIFGHGNDVEKDLYLKIVKTLI